MPFSGSSFRVGGAIFRVPEADPRPFRIRLQREFESGAETKGEGVPLLRSPKEPKSTGLGVDALWLKSRVFIEDSRISASVSRVGEMGARCLKNWIVSSIRYFRSTGWTIGRRS